MKRVVVFLTFFVLSAGAFAQKKAHLEGVETGMAAPEFTMPTFDGDTFNLSDLRGKVVLINFWASWCAPCRKKAPALLELHEKYRDEEFDDGATGFEIVCVSLDRNQTAWKNSIQKDQTGGLINVGDMKGWNCDAAINYNIKRIPTLILINGEGNIVALDPGTADLNKKLKRMRKWRWFW